MGEKCVTYSQWLEYVRYAKEKGIKSDEMQFLSQCYPQVNMQDYQDYLNNELTKLEISLLKKVVDKFQTSVNMCLDELDLELLERALKEFKKEVSICFFFNKITQYPQNMREKLTLQMLEGLSGFAKEFQMYVKRIEDGSNDLFISDFSYICKKAKIIKYIEELNIYV